MNKLCIYHGNCADGFTAAWAVWKRYPDAEFHAAHYGQPPPDCTDRVVIMVDFSYKRPVLLEMAKQAITILILDHHKSAEADLVDLPENVNAIFDMERSGAMLAWNYYHGTINPAPRLVEHVQDRDLWRFKLAGTRPFQANLFSMEYTFSDWEFVNNLCQNEEGYWSFIAQGEAIERKHFKDVNELIKSAATRTTIASFDVPVLNAPYFYSSDAGHIMGTNEPFAACYYDNANGRVYSLRSEENGEDVSKIAALFGGGGHQHAAGFQLPFDKLHTLETGHGLKVIK
jgi:oligoribonuclease NrnB/cAMP/cGMP phosphodiesterase (DHH superfamily)